MGFETYVPVDVVFEDEGCGDVFLDDAGLGSVKSGLLLPLAERVVYRCKTFMCALQEPMFPMGRTFAPSLPGRAFSETSSPLTPSTQVMSMPVKAAAKVKMSRLSVRDGRLIA